MKLNTVGIALSYYREKYGLSMTQVCEGICSPATMFRIEEGYREVDSLVSATLLSRRLKPVERCFNPRTHEECDELVWKFVLDKGGFNPRTHEECDR